MLKGLDKEINSKLEKELTFTNLGGQSSRSQDATCAAVKNRNKAGLAVLG